MQFCNTAFFFNIYEEDMAEINDTELQINFSIWSHCVKQVYLGFDHNKSL